MRAARATRFFSLFLISDNRELTKRRRRRQRRRYKTIDLVSKNNGPARSARAFYIHFGTFLCRRLLNDDVK